MKIKTAPNLLTTRSAMALALSSVCFISDSIAGTSDLLEEVRVTAQKKNIAESVQDVPIAITAMSGDKIEAEFVINLTDIKAPNTNLSPLSTFPGVANFSIRGSGVVGNSLPSSDPAVSVVVDGLTYGTIYGVIADLFDLESLEILRGPQGTLFGRNATGGAVVMRTTRPTEEFQGKVKATLGDYGRTDLSAVVSGPLNDNWSGKIGITSNHHDGYWDNKAVGGKQGEADTMLVRPALHYKSEAFDTTLIMEYAETESDGLATITHWVDGEQVLDPYDEAFTLQGIKGDSELNWFNAVLEANWDMGEGVLTGVLGYREVEQDYEGDIDGLSDILFHLAAGTFLEQDQSSLELRWAGPISDSISLTTGVYLFQQEYTYGERRILLNAVDRRGVSSIDHDSQAVFAQADVNLSADLVLTLGGRYSRESKDAEIGLIGDPRASGDCATQGAPFEKTATLNDCQPVFEDNESWGNFSPKVGLTWTINDDVMTYASYSKGFRSGGYNVRFTDLSFVTDNPETTPGPYDEESVDAYEIGLKSSWFGGKTRVNLAYFYNETDDLQRTVLNTAGGQQILNAASAQIQGLELEATAMLTENFILQLMAGWTDAKYDEFDAAETATGRPAKDLEFVMLPELTTSIAATYDMEVGDWGDVLWRTSYTSVDETWADDVNSYPLKSYSLWDASVAFTNSEGNLRASVFGRNLTDEVYYQFGVSVDQIGFRNYYLAPPRTYGIELSYEF